MRQKQIHSFHIPVMGLAYTIDSPAKVGRYGISSVVSVVEDRLIEMMRGYYYAELNEKYQPISDREPDYRVKRIKDYLNLLNRVVKKQFEELKNSAFEKGSELVKYFELLPENHSIKLLYNKMMAAKSEFEKLELQTTLRQLITPGGIDVNIMTKVDRENYDKEGNSIANGSDALTALKGYAESDLENSSIIFSAGLNPRLFNYLEQFDTFKLNEDGSCSKRIVIKVSDYRSALIQGKYLAKKGIWVSEFRIESGLNCGGHAFATDGYLIGPILQEFKSKREELVQSLFEVYQKAFELKGATVPNAIPQLRVTYQGGVGTAAEHDFLSEYYQLDSIGWGSPFLLVPEATTVDTKTLELLAKSTEEDVVLSHNSPLGVRFNYLNRTTSDYEKHERIANAKPGSPCTEKYLQNNTEFTEKPICTASIEYQKLKIADIQKQDISILEKKKQITAVLSKECLCIGLSNSASIDYKIPFLKNLNAVTICPGPNISYFNRTTSLKEMVGHIYGRENVLGNITRPDVFTKELQLYISYLKEQVDELTDSFNQKKEKYVLDFKSNLEEGINYYRKIVNNLSEYKVGARFEEGLANLENEIQVLFKNKLHTA
ncbi:hypothetical protein C3K47_18695 [Solitalea longa]|uniref:Uncharacterized protein n=1 Tax=Solitalea longa TaxID=2079460 RepID=A0A2S4ZY01_9SPHI|nr:hypothetical protein [Solitalea longa]POY34763.1 hypothetical protein C3K47_18695 [Solitalea longa]